MSQLYSGPTVVSFSQSSSLIRYAAHSLNFVECFFSLHFCVFSSFLMLFCIFRVNITCSCFIKVFPSLLVLLFILSLDIRFNCFIKVFPSLVVLFCILCLDILFSYLFSQQLGYSFQLFHYGFSSLLVLLCILSVNILFSCFIKVFPSLLVLLCILSQDILFSFINLARVSCCNIAAYFLFVLTGSLASLHAINFSFSLSSLHNADFLFISSTPKLLISEDDGWTLLHLISYFLCDSVTTKTSSVLCNSLLSRDMSVSTLLINKGSLPIFSYTTR